jgi:hypothetical protein
MDLASFAGADYVDLTLDGTTYRVGELTLREWAPIQAWIKANVPGPLSSLGSPDFKRLPSDVKRDLLAEAMVQDRTSWPPRIGTPEWMLSLDHEGGHEELILALLGKCQPFDRPAAKALAGRVTLVEILPAVLAGLGIFGPKSPTPGEAKAKADGAADRTPLAKGPSTSRRPGAGQKTRSST